MPVPASDSAPSPAPDPGSTPGTADFDLDQKYTLERGRVLLTGIQALVRLPLDQHRADRARGLRTATFISGYQGSPLGTFDMTIERNLRLLSDHDVVWVPGVNEDLAATAVWGSQEPLLGPLDRHDGVLGMWYGKGPGVDRCGDVFKHANYKGAAPNGGVLALAGDDPMAKSSTLPTHTEPTFYDAQMPILYPGSVQEMLDLGLHGFALSRYSGLWVGFKVVTTLADALATAEVAPDRVAPAEPELVIDGQPWRHVQQPGLVTPISLGQEAEIAYGRLEAAKAYAAANRLNRISGARSGAWLGIVAAGRTFHELCQALADLGLGGGELSRRGVRLLQVGMVWPLEPTVITELAKGLTEILVLDEKRAFMELFVRDILYGRSDAPRIVGKHDEKGRLLVPADGELTADRIAPIVAARLRGRLALPGSEMEARLALIEEARRATGAEIERTPYFCSGCPHNRSTEVPEGSIAAGGVGCHAMSLWIDDRALTIHQMGGEGATWIGRAPFTDRSHLFQNLGDGTLFHSGSLAVRAAVAAGVSLTYKILYNGTVAMTGGQPVAGAMDVPELAAALAAEGASRIVVCSDDPDRFRSSPGFPAGADVWPRDRLEEAQRALRDTPGVTVLIYDQRCAAEKRRDRKRGVIPTPAKRIFINEAVCEGCGDCGAKSHCLSVQPVDTEFGPKTRIHQSSCNFDYTCIEGDCPSFIEVAARPGPRPARPAAPDLPVEFPEPARPPVPAGGYSLYMAGMGGTGVVTASQVLATAALLEGLEVSGLDQTGLSQKGGPVVSHLRLFDGPAGGSNYIGAGLADCYLGFDLLVAANPRNLARAAPERTLAAVSVSRVPTGEMVAHPDEPYPDADDLLLAIDRVTRKDDNVRLDSVQMAEALFGDHMQANFLTLGAAYQAGGVPVSAESVERAIELNGVAVAANKAAFAWGRCVVADPAAARDAVAAEQAGAPRAVASVRASVEARALIGRSSLVGAVAGLVERRAADLVDYQSRALAARYVEFLGRVAEREQWVMGRDAADLTETVAFYLYKLMAYKDEYEVARLHLRPEVGEAVRTAFGDSARYRLLLHPPLLRALGLKRKLRFGPRWRPLLRLLRAGRKLRGTWLDPFGATAMRRLERALVDEYRAIVEAELDGLTPASYDRAIRLAGTPDLIRGYEEIKLAGVERFRDEVRAIRDPAAVPVELGPKPADG